MKVAVPIRFFRRFPPVASLARHLAHLRPFVVAVLGFILPAVGISAQITIDTRTGVVTNGNTSIATVDRRYQQITPTNVPLTKSELDPKTRLELIRVLTAEQGFAMRPFPRGHKGLTLAANGKLEPAGEPYLNMITSEGMASKPGDRLVLSDIKIERNKMIFDINGGPDPKHRLLRHIQIGVGQNTNPVVQDDGSQPTGTRLTLTFQEHVPELTGSEVKALLAPLISFDVKTPIQAFTDTLPTVLKQAILEHHVMVGMSTDMVLFAKGQPASKIREMDGQMPFEEWIYGRPPEEVDFVRINGNRVIRVEVAKMGESPVIFTKDEVEGLLRTDGTALDPHVQTGPRVAKVGDVETNPDTQAPAPPPSLRNPGEKLPADTEQTGVMKPVRFPKSSNPGSQSGSPSRSDSTSAPPAKQPGANPDEAPSIAPPLPDASQSAPPKQ